MSTPGILQAITLVPFFVDLSLGYVVLFVSNFLGRFSFAKFTNVGLA